MECCGSEGGVPCCRVESLISIDERGQMVMPKEIRDKAGIRPGDKLAVVSCGQPGNVFCLALIKAEKLDAMMRDILGPVMKETFK